MKLLVLREIFNMQRTLCRLTDKNCFVGGMDERGFCETENFCFENKTSTFPSETEIKKYKFVLRSKSFAKTKRFISLSRFQENATLNSKDFLLRFFVRLFTIFSDQQITRHFTKLRLKQN